MKIAFTGSHRTGKTTATFSMCEKMKLQNPTAKVGILYDVNRFAPKFNKDATELSQLWIFGTRLTKETELDIAYNILVCDRTIFDNIAYTYYMGFKELGDETLKIAKRTFLKTYDTIFFKSIKNNQFVFDNGYSDTKDTEYRNRIEEILLDIYTSMNVHDYINFVLM